MRKYVGKFLGEGIGARSRRSAIWSLADFAGGQFIRLISNLILARLLFPEAFGVMALVSVIIMGLTLFSDTGIRNSIIQSTRGDDPQFLNTAWSVQVVRGALLWLLTLVLAQPIAVLYDQPILEAVIPISGLMLLIQGFLPTSIYTANRHLQLGRYTQITLGAQILNLAVTAIMAWQLQSVWALVIGSVVGAVFRVVGYFIFLPNSRNEFRFEARAFSEIFHFGKWIFLSSIAFFMVSQGDRAMLAFFIPLDVLGIYSIAYLLAHSPVALTNALHGRVVVPLYRLKNPLDSVANRISIFRARRLISVYLLGIAIALTALGPWLVGVLYDQRYAAAGPMITLYGLSLVALICLDSVSHALVGLGDTRRHFFLTACHSMAFMFILFVGIETLGVAGALLAPGLAVIIVYPLRLMFAKRYSVFDPWQDFGLSFLGFLLVGFVCAYHWDLIVSLSNL